jgi:hypothetical protein
MVRELAILPASTMATTSNTISSSTSIPTSFAIPVAEKLTKSNHLLWHTQIMPAIRVVQLQGFLDGTEPKPSKTLQKKVSDTIVDEPNPAYAQWVACDQAVLGYLLSSLTQVVHTSVTTMTTSAEV